MEIFMYYFLLILMCALIINLIFIIRRKCPKKISVLMNVMMILFLIRCISLIFLSITNSNNYALMIGRLSELNVIYVPAVIFITVYIFRRDNGMKFISVYPYIAVFAVLFGTEMYFSKYSLKIIKQFGFVIFSSNELIENFIFITVLVFLSIISIKVLLEPRSNKAGMIFLIISIVSMVVERFLFIYEVSVFPLPVISEFILLMTSYYTVSTFKKIKNVWYWNKLKHLDKLEFELIYKF